MKRIAALVCLAVLASLIVLPATATFNNQPGNTSVADSNGPVPPIPPGSGNFLPTPQSNA